MFRPRDSHDMRLLSTSLTLTPSAKVRWFHDVFGNSIAIARFSEPGDHLALDSVFTVEHYGLTETNFPIEKYARTVPFAYGRDEVSDLARTNERHYRDPDHRVDGWARGFLLDYGTTDTSVMLMTMTQAIKANFHYEAHERMTQGPVDTLERRSGTCRDFALLMMEAVRSLGIAARFVSGYLYDPALDGSDVGMVGAGATHAWVQVYLPGAGWVEYDPTNGLVGGPNLIRVAVVRDPAQAIPVDGSYNGAAGDFLDMSVNVTVTRELLPQGPGVLKERNLGDELSSTASPGQT